MYLNKMAKENGIDPRIWGLVQVSVWFPGKTIGEPFLKNLNGEKSRRELYTHYIWSKKLNCGYIFSFNHRSVLFVWNRCL